VKERPHRLVGNTLGTDMLLKDTIREDMREKLYKWNEMERERELQSVV
jgi:hypothetical protein